MKRAGLGLAAAMAAALWASGAGAETPALFPGDAALRAAYALPHSRFTVMDGETIHYVDEGKGEPIVLLHGSFASLRQWDGWARTLSRHYRVIRLDMSPAGLSGPNPNADYTTERRMQIVDRLTRMLKVDRFVLVATSSAGLVGAGYAAEHPDRLKGLILNNIAVDQVAIDTAHFSPALKRALAEDATHSDHHVPEFWRQILMQNFADPAKVTAGMAQEWTDLNNRALKMPPAPKPAGGPPPWRTLTDLPRIVTPTLLLWSQGDPETTLEKDGKGALQRLAAQDKSLVVIPRCGHMMPMECGDAGLAMAMPFLRQVAAPDAK